MEKVYKQARKFLAVVYALLAVTEIIELVLYLTNLAYGTPFLSVGVFFLVTVVQLIWFHASHKKEAPAFFTIFKACAVFLLETGMYRWLAVIDGSTHGYLAGAVIALTWVWMAVAIAAELVFALRLKLAARKEAKEQGILRTKTEKIVGWSTGVFTVLYLQLVCLALSTKDFIVWTSALSFYALCTLVQTLLFHLSKGKIAPWWLPIVKVALVLAVFFISLVYSIERSYPFVCDMIVAAVAEIITALLLRRVRKSEKAEAEALSVADKANIAEE